MMIRRRRKLKTLFAAATSLVTTATSTASTAYALSSVTEVDENSKNLHLRRQQESRKRDRIDAIPIRFLPMNDDEGDDYKTFKKKKQQRFRADGGRDLRSNNNNQRRFAWNADDTWDTNDDYLWLRQWFTKAGKSTKSSKWGKSLPFCDEISRSGLRSGLWSDDGWRSNNNNEPTSTPTISPTKAPNNDPTQSPTISPTWSPTVSPTILVSSGFTHVSICRCLWV